MGDIKGIVALGLTLNMRRTKARLSFLRTHLALLALALGVTLGKAATRLPLGWGSC
jgi:hypothetical protein